MKHVYYTCDRCNKKLSEGQRCLELAVDRQMDAAGSIEDVTECMDICFDCLLAAVYKLMKNKSYEERKAFMDDLKERKFRVKSN